MTAYVSFLRGINVGGKNRIKMAELRECLGSLGFNDVATYIASGNVLFDAPPTPDAELAASISGAIERGFDLQIPVVVRTADELCGVRNNNPLSDEAGADPKKLHVYFLDAAPQQALVDEVLAGYEGPETALLHGRELYVYFPEGAGRSKFPFAKLERRIGGIATGRNWNTVVKIGEMLVGR